ncbi:MAG: non-canonical purine NTP pyrophosphatase, partial [Clostridia bacterium]|nr:non-canonical purine NTP pyrophosphatase [Clostridia bacterium]
GEVKGYITKEPKGNNGFGYDPIFFSDELGKTFAEGSDDEKNSVSHRGRALKNLYEKLKAMEEN